MASTDTNSISGTELITNGDFATDVSGWTDTSVGTGSTAWSASGAVLSTITPSQFGRLRQQITCVVGATYRVSVVVASGTTLVQIGAGAIATNDIYQSPETGTQTFVFVATDTNIGIGILENQASSSNTVESVSVKRVDVDVSPNENHLDVTGTLTRTAVATGSDLVGYGDFSASNYGLVDASVADTIDTGDFFYSAWVKLSGTESYFSITSGATDINTGLHWGMSSTRPSAAPEVVIAGATVFSTVSSTAETIYDNAWHMLWVKRTGTTVQMGIDLVVVGSGTSSGTVYDVAGARVGVRGDGQQGLSGELALLSIHDTDLTAEQIATKYNIERYWFEPNAVISLDSSVVRTVAYDKALKNYHVLTDTGHSVYDGRTFVRLEYTAGDWDWITVDDGKVAKG